jgi:predicted phosphate transport protein (TIGR00153 family)
MVRFRLFPRSEKKFFDMFNEAARNIHQGARAFHQMLEDFQGTDEQWRAVEEYEHEGDKITHRILRTLHQTFITPVDREDIHRLTVALDDVIDLIEASAARMAMYKVVKPTPEALRLAALIVRSTDQIVRGVTGLPRFEEIQEHCIEINRLENEADEVSREAIAALFVGEVPPIEVIKWKEIYETMETATDRCEDVANLLEEIALKHS